MSEEKIKELEGAFAAAVQAYEREAVRNIKLRDGLEAIVKHFEAVAPDSCMWSSVYSIAQNALKKAI